jgi:hypothetical protein
MFSRRSTEREVERLGFVRNGMDQYAGRFRRLHHAQRAVAEQRASDALSVPSLIDAKAWCIDTEPN